MDTIRLKHLITDSLQWINFIALAGVAVSWMLPWYVEKTFLWVYCATFVIEAILSKRAPKRKDHFWWVMIAYLMFCLYPIIPQLLSGGTLEERFFVRTLENHLPFLLFAIVGICGFQEKIKIRYLAYIIHFAALAMVCYVFFSKLPDLPWLHHFGLQAGDGMFTASNPMRRYALLQRCNLGSHMKVNVFYNISFLCTFYLLTRSNTRLWVRITLLITVIPTIIALLITEGRTGFVTFLVISCVMLCVFFFHTQNIKRRLIALTMILAFVSVGLSIALQNRVTQKSIHKDPRIELWQTGLDMVIKNPWGYGASKGKELYVERVFDETDTTWFTNWMPEPEKRYLIHPHNAYLEETISQGYIGLLLFLLVLFLPCILSSRQRTMYLLLCTFVIAAQYFFDVFSSVPYMVCALWSTVWLRAHWD